MGVSEEDIDKVIEESSAYVDSDDIYVAFGLAIISSYNEFGINNFESKTMQKGDFGYCLKEATGVNALVTLGNTAYTLYTGEVAASMAVDAVAAAAFRKAALKAATKVIAGFATGFGAVVMVIDFVTCMSKS